MARRRRFLTSVLFLSPLLVGLPLISTWRHYALPAPVLDDFDNRTNAPTVSERVILEHARYLSENIGYRTVGTREHAEADIWFLEKVKELEALCEHVVREEPTRKLECEVWRQVGSGSHRFDLLQKRLYKTYVNLTNIVLRISDGTDSGKKHALLANAHLDSTLPSPGAADDALPSGVMLEAARTLIRTPGWSPMYALVFLWNNAEESLQDGSHLFSTQHPVARTVRAALNLEAAGTRGPELLFQATSEQMIEAYARVPHPYGTVLANDIFASGIMMSDTDFRQFQLYLDVTGLDMAIVGHSYFYHTRKDLVRYIEPGVAQHMADNTLALLKFLSSPDSPLPELTTGYSRPSTVYFSFLSSFFIRYSFATANAMHILLLVSTIILVSATSPTSLVVSKKETHVPFSTQRQLEDHLVKENGSKVPEVSETVTISRNIWLEIAKGMLLNVVSLFSAALSTNFVAFLMVHVVKHPLSWFKSESSCIFLYGPAALAGALSAFSFLSECVPSLCLSERTLFESIVLSHAILAVVGQLAGLGSAGVFFLSGCSAFAGLLLDSLVNSGFAGIGSEQQLEYERKRANGNVTMMAKNHEHERKYGNGHEHRHKHGHKYGQMTLVPYALGLVAPLLLGTEMFWAVSDIFVPLTGRMGAEAPAENIIATIVTLISSYLLPFVLPFFCRFGAHFVWRAALRMIIITVLMMALFAVRSPFDAMHPKRLFIIHSENITTGEVILGVGTSDTAAGFETLVQDIAAFVTENQTRAVKVDMHEYNGDWDVLYPFSAHLSPYHISLEHYESEYTPLSTASADGADSTYGDDGRLEFGVRAVDDVIDAVAGTRSLTLEVRHPGIIWTTIAFDAHVLKWSLDSEPPPHYARHFVKEASFFGEDVWRMDLVVKLHSVVESDVNKHNDREEQTEYYKSKVEIGSSELRVNFIGLRENAMWPGKARDYEALQQAPSDGGTEVRGGAAGKATSRVAPRAMQVFAVLDEWLEHHTQGTVDATLLGCVGGIAVV